MAAAAAGLPSRRVVSRALRNVLVQGGVLAATALRLAVFAMVAVIIVAFGRNAVERIAARTAAAPVRSGLIGLLAEILFVPVLF